MSQAHLTPQAEADLDRIWLYIADDGPAAADAFLARILKKSHVLMEQPGIGRKRDELAPGLRSFPVGVYLIFYRPTEDGIEIIRVLSGYRDLDTLFDF